MRLERHDRRFEDVAAELPLAVDELVDFERNRHARVEIDFRFPERVGERDIGKPKRADGIITRWLKRVRRARDRDGCRLLDIRGGGALRARKSSGAGGKRGGFQKLTTIDSH